MSGLVFFFPFYSVFPLIRSQLKSLSKVNKEKNGHAEHSDKDKCLDVANKTLIKKMSTGKNISTYVSSISQIIAWIKGDIKLLELAAVCSSAAGGHSK